MSDATTTTPSSTSRPSQAGPSTRKRTRKADRKPDPSKAPKHTPIKRILNHITLNPDATVAEIAAECNVSRQAINQMLLRYGITDNVLESFKKGRADIFAGIQESVAASFTEADIKKASVRDRTILLGTLYDKERLERGQSTQNVQSLHISCVVAASKAMDEQEP